MKLRQIRARLARRIRAYLEPFEAPLHGQPDASPPPDPLQEALALEALATGWFNAKTGEVVPDFPVGPDDVVLDFGCGDRPMIAGAAVPAREILLADIDAVVLEAGRVHVAAHQASPVRAILVKDDSLPLGDDSVTRVVATEVLEHVAEPERVMRELVRVACRGALFLISVPDPTSENLQRPLAAPNYFEPPNHIRVFQREAFRALIVDSGLEIIRVDFYGFYWALWWCFFWTCGEGQDFANPHPLLQSWTRTWGMLLQNPTGKNLKAILDGFLPKSQLIVARKP